MESSTKKLVSTLATAESIRKSYATRTNSAKVLHDLGFDMELREVFEAGAGAESLRRLKYKNPFGFI